MLKFAIVATRRRSQAVFGPFHSWAEATAYETQLAASTEIVNFDPQKHRRLLKPDTF